MLKREACHTLFYHHFLTFLFHSAARGKKAEALRVLFADDPSVEVVEVPNIIDSQFQDALVGVDAVIHVASPLPGRDSPQGMLSVRSVLEASHSL